MEEQEKPAEGDKPETSKGPKDPKDRAASRPENEGGAGDPTTKDVPAWMASLPAEYREAWQNQEWEKIPARYRELIERYADWLHSQRAETR